MVVFQEYIEQIPSQRIISRYQKQVVLWEYNSGTDMDELVEFFVHGHPAGWGKRRYEGCRGCKQKARWKKLVRANLKKTKELMMA